MKRMKMLVCLSMLAMVLSLTGCGRTTEKQTAGNQTENLQESNGTENSDTIETDSETVDRQEDTVSQNGDNSGSSDKTDTVELEPFNTMPVIAETVLYDENDVKITANELNYTNYSVELDLTIENNGDKDLGFVSNSMGYSCNAVNGYMVADGYMNADVPAGKKAKETVKFGMNELMMYGITEIADIQLGFDITDSDYNHIYSGPRQVKTTIAETYDYAADTYRKSIESGTLAVVCDAVIEYDAADELYNQNDIRIVSETLITNADGEKGLFLEIENTSDEPVYVVTSDISVNNLVLQSSDWSSDSINPGTRRVVILKMSSLLKPIYQSVFEINDIAEVTFSLTVKNAEYEEVVPAKEVNLSITDTKNSFDVSGAELYNENGIRIISKGLMEDLEEYSDDSHLLLLVENNSLDMINVTDKYGSLSLNGFMTDYFARSAEIPAGRSAVLDVEIRKSSLEDNGILDVAEISETELALEIKDGNRKTIAEPVIVITY